MTCKNAVTAARFTVIAVFIFAIVLFFLCFAKVLDCYIGLESVQQRISKHSAVFLSCLPFL